MPTKKELLQELEELGVEASPKSTKAELEEALQEAKSGDNEDRIEPDKEDDQVEEEVEEPRLESESSESLPETDTGEDYLRKYQYRKQTVPGSKESDPPKGSRADIMKQGLLKQPRVRIFIPRAPGEHKSILQSVTLNNYRLDFPKQTYLEVPQQVAEVIMDSQAQTDEAIARGQIAGDDQKETALL